MKGIILAGGTGSRLYPLTFPVCKQLLPVYDKPMIYYPLSTLMMAGIKDILIISTPKDICHFVNLFGSGSRFGLNVEYKEQVKPNGLAKAFVLGKEFIENDSVCLVLGDNIFYGQDFYDKIQIHDINGATIFGYHVSNPSDYGIVEFDEDDNPIQLIEKPVSPKSNYAVPGLYFYDNDVIEIAENLKPSARGEYEITDVNNEYLNRGKLNVKTLSRGTAWLDTGTFDSLLQASNFVQTVQSRQGINIGCIEEVALQSGFINEHQFKVLASTQNTSDYGKYLNNILR
jgi:glucose-1-phosphate thymidylyltransferase